jgi:hypothetical protein
MNPTSLLLALAVLGGAVAAPAAPAAGSRRTWQLAMYTWVKRQPAEAGAPPNGHPLRVDPASLGQALASIRIEDAKGEPPPLFAPDEAASLGRALAEALAAAGPGEDLELVSTAKRGGFLSDSLSVTARVFARDGRVNLIFHDVRQVAVSGQGFDYKAPLFVVGSRTRPSQVAVRAEGAGSPRADWLVLPALAASAPVPLPTPPVAAPAVPPSAPVLSPAAPAGEPSPFLDERLRHLKRLREENLITEEEYAKRKAELLKEI